MGQSARKPFGRVLQPGKKALRLHMYMSCHFPDRFAILGRFKNDVHQEANDYGTLTNKHVNGGWVVSCRVHLSLLQDQVVDVHLTLPTPL
jgi:hypothetical protein